MKFIIQQEGKNLTTQTCINLFQPWADGIISKMFPVLVRTFPINKQECIAIAATEGIDGIFFNLLDELNIQLVEKYLQFGVAIGSVEVIDCIEIKNKEVFRELRKIAGKEAYQFYPAHLAPLKEKVFFWIIKKPIRFKVPIPLRSRGITWSKIEINQESMKKTKRKGFWDYFDYKVYLRINKELRKQLILLNEEEL